MSKYKKLLKKGFYPEGTVEIVDTVYCVGSPYPQALVCKWWAEDSKGQRMLIEEKILTCKEKI